MEIFWAMLRICIAWLSYPPNSGPRFRLCPWKGRFPVGWNPWWGWCQPWSRHASEGENEEDMEIFHRDCLLCTFGFVYFLIADGANFACAWKSIHVSKEAYCSNFPVADACCWGAWNHISYFGIIAVKICGCTGGSGSVRIIVVFTSIVALGLPGAGLGPVKKPGKN